MREQLKHPVFRALIPLISPADHGTRALHRRAACGRLCESSADARFLTKNDRDRRALPHTYGPFPKPDSHIDVVHETPLAMPRQPSDGSAGAEGTMNAE